MTRMSTLILPLCDSCDSGQLLFRGSALTLLQFLDDVIDDIGVAHDVDLAFRPVHHTAGVSAIE